MDMVYRYARQLLISKTGMILYYIMQHAAIVEANGTFGIQTIMHNFAMEQQLTASGAKTGIMCNPDFVKLGENLNMMRWRIKDFFHIISKTTHRCIYFSAETGECHEGYCTDYHGLAKPKIYVRLF